MSKEKKILWIDDEFDTQMDGFIEIAFESGLDIVGFKSKEEFDEEIKLNQKDYYAILLDGYFYEKKDDVIGSEDNTEINKKDLKVDHIFQIYKEWSKTFEIFIYSGNSKIHDNEMLGINFENKIYKKNDKKERNRLLKDLNKACENHEAYKIKSDYKEGFDVCTEKYIGNKAGDILLKILKNKEDYSMNYVRKILEALFKKYKKLELIPSNLDFAQTSRFLSGDIENNFQLNESSRLPVPISETLRCIIRTVNPGSHYTSDEELKKDVDKYLSNKYSKKAIVLLLMDVLIDFKRQIDSNPVRNNWKVINSIEGEIIQLFPEKGYGFLKYTEKAKLFFYLNESENSEDLKTGDKVDFFLSKNQKGDKAIKVNKT